MECCCLRRRYNYYSLVSVTIRLGRSPADANGGQPFVLLVLGIGGVDVHMGHLQGLEVGSIVVGQGARFVVAHIGVEGLVKDGTDLVLQIGELLWGQLRQLIGGHALLEDLLQGDRSGGLIGEGVNAMPVAMAADVASARQWGPGYSRALSVHAVNTVNAFVGVADKSVKIPESRE